MRSAVGLVGGLDHDPHHRLGARGTQQHAATVTEFSGCRVATACSD